MYLVPMSFIKKAYEKEMIEKERIFIPLFFLAPYFAFFFLRLILHSFFLRLILLYCMMKVKSEKVQWE